MNMTTEAKEALLNQTGALGEPMDGVVPAIAQYVRQILMPNMSGRVVRWPGSRTIGDSCWIYYCQAKWLLQRIWVHNASRHWRATPSTNWRLRNGHP